jgi:hypothetical protein
MGLKWNNSLYIIKLAEASDVRLGPEFRLGASSLAQISICGGFSVLTQGLGAFFLQCYAALSKAVQATSGGVSK